MAWNIATISVDQIFFIFFFLVLLLLNPSGVKQSPIQHVTHAHAAPAKWGLTEIVSGAGTHGRVLAGAFVPD